MLRLISKKCTNFLIKQEPDLKEKQNIYIYGFELLWSNTFCIFSIFVIGYFFKHIELSVVFLLYFMPIRTVAGGYHCNSYLNCYLLTNTIAVLCSVVSVLLKIMNFNKYLIYIIFLISLSYIWKHASLSTQYQSESVRERNHKYAHIIIVIETISLMHIRYFCIDTKIYMAVITTVVVAFMIYMQKRKES